MRYDNILTGTHHPNLTKMKQLRHIKFGRKRYVFKKDSEVCSCNSSSKYQKYNLIMAFYDSKVINHQIDLFEKKLSLFLKQ